MKRIAATNKRFGGVGLYVQCPIIAGGRADQTAGIIFRYQDQNNYYLLNFSVDRKKIRLIRVMNGQTETIRATGQLDTEGLPHDLKAGQWVVADAVLVDDVSVPTDSPWTGRLAARLTEASRGLVLGANAMVAEATQKASLHRTTGAVAVDMESHIVARVAPPHRLPFAAARVTSDAAHHNLPPAVLVGMKSDGGMDLPAVLRSLLANPGQLPTLIRTGLEAERGFRALLRGHRRLGPRLGGPDLG